MTLFHPLSADVRARIDAFPPLIDKVFPLPGQFRHTVPNDIIELSRLLTGNKGSRTLSYLGKPALLSAYLRYFLPWNVYRLCRLLPSLSISLKPDDMIADLGSGPLTFVIALWIATPELRETPLEFRCIDHTQAVLDAGKKAFFALAGERSAWTIKTIKDYIYIRPPVYGKRPALVTAVNVCNEMYQNLPHTASLYAEADKIGRMLTGLAPQALVVEPGVPRSGEFISLLRSVFLRASFDIASPCPHTSFCPLSRAADRSAERERAKSKWCHFAFDTIGAPEALLKLSTDAGLPKERAALSFLFAQSGEVASGDSASSTNKKAGRAISGTGRGAGGSASGESRVAVQVRVLSDCFPLPPPTPGQKPCAGRYGCSEKGLVLIRGGEKAVGRLFAGTLLSLQVSRPERRDAKTNALLIEVTKE
ncbi:MAG: small ribosomal subunit Rsm22 family protein [Treponema sp.]|jgi:hypothetical protein|nr:small ribosomal subunit Rsm22 family protein [Treponema sp.]